MEQQFYVVRYKDGKIISSKWWDGKQWGYTPKAYSRADAEAEAERARAITKADFIRITRA